MNILYLYCIFTMIMGFGVALHFDLEDGVEYSIGARIISYIAFTIFAPVIIPIKLGVMLASLEPKS